MCPGLVAASLVLTEGADLLSLWESTSLDLLGIHVSTTRGLSVYGFQLMDFVDKASAGTEWDHIALCRLNHLEPKKQITWKFPLITVPKMGEIYIGPRIIIGT